ncbi:MAG TPA: NAD(P)-binding protein, partial [Candidatus Dormibacteraeota bacterium]
MGAGASGLAFADTLAAEANVDVALVDRREAPGGHWRQAYPFVRLHTPSAYYGVNSSTLGDDRIDQSGENAGFYERATGEDVREYFAKAAERLIKTGRVHLLAGHEHLGGGPDGEQVRDLSTGKVHDIRVRQKVVDARYLEASIPAAHVPSFEVVPSARVVPVNDLPEVTRPKALFAVLGSGKTAVDACVWLLDNGVEPDRIRWIRPREAWFYDRRHFQPLDLVSGIIEGLALDAEAGAQASSIGDLFERLENTGRLVRVDPSRPATMFRGTMLSSRELDAVRQIKDVLRLGHIKRIEADRLLLDRGEAATRPEVVHIDCTALGLNNAPGTPIFQPGKIVLQQVRH